MSSYDIFRCELCQYCGQCLEPLWCQLNTLKVLQRSKVQTSKKQANGTNSRSLFFINNE